VSALDGRVALVTGAARGIGRGIARRLAAAGVDVVVADLVDDASLAAEAAQTVADVESFGRRGWTVRCDVRDEASCDAAVAFALEQAGRLDIVCANAGVLRITPVHELTVAEFERTVDVNLLGVFRTCKAAMPHFRAQRSGCYVNVASVSGLRGAPGLAHYSATKAGVITFTQTLALELGPDGIRANCVLPGTVATDLSLAEAARRGVPGDRAMDLLTEAVLPRMPLGRIQTPDDIGDAVVYLCSADNVSGTSINVSGGSVL
jgi:meso-butanediol dehydrogenase/(S,S)-butanediol dehydrogenase/diacetyl reductase